MNTTDSRNPTVTTESRPPHRTRTVRRCTRIAAVGAASILAVTGLAACGDDGGGGSGGDVSDAASEETVTETVAGDAGQTADPDGTDGDAAETPAPAPDETDGAAAPGACTIDQLQTSVGDQQGAAGSVLVNVDLTNGSDSDCTVDGYPGVALVGEDDQPIGAPATREQSGDVTPVDLAPGESATAAVKISRAENYDENECGPLPATGLQVIPPDETSSSVAGLEGVTGCSNENVELLSVQPLQPAA